MILWALAPSTPPSWDCPSAGSLIGVPRARDAGVGYHPVPAPGLRAFGVGSPRHAQRDVLVADVFACAGSRYFAHWAWVTAVPAVW